eukprot:6811393-Prorocentrum_lima.AAC.1
MVYGRSTFGVERGFALTVKALSLQQLNMAEDRESDIVNLVLDWKVEEEEEVLRRVQVVWRE